MPTGVCTQRTRRPIGLRHRIHQNNHTNPQYNHAVRRFDTVSARRDGCDCQPNSLLISHQHSGASTFYRAMHSLQCKARSCSRLSSVCPSVCNVGGSRPHKLKVLETNCMNISQASSLFVAKRSSTYSQGNMEKFWGRLGVGWEKVAFWSTKAAISLKRVKIEEKLL